MGGGTPAGDAAVGSDAPRKKSLATADTIQKGCIAWVEKNGQPRRAEILSIRDMKSGVRQFYCNFDNFNKRLDEWVPADRVDFTREVEWPNSEKEKPKKDPKKGPVVAKKSIPKKGQKRPLNKREQSMQSEATTPQHPWTGEMIRHHVLCRMLFLTLTLIQ
jgi:histone acetyltransferase HTATIP